MGSDMPELDCVYWTHWHKDPDILPFRLPDRQTPASGGVIGES